MDGEKEGKAAALVLSQGTHTYETISISDYGAEIKGSGQSMKVCQLVHADFPWSRFSCCYES